MSKRYQVWAKWKYCDPQVEEDFATPEEAKAFMEKFEKEQKVPGSNLTDTWIQSTKFTEYLEREFSEDF